MFRGSLWVAVLEASLNDRLDFMRRLKAMPMEHASNADKAYHAFRIESAKRQIDDVVADLAKARGEA